MRKSSFAHFASAFFFLFSTFRKCSIVFSTTRNGLFWGYFDDVNTSLQFLIFYSYFQVAHITLIADEWINNLQAGRIMLTSSPIALSGSLWPHTISLCDLTPYYKAVVNLLKRARRSPIRGYSIRWFLLYLPYQLNNEQSKEWFFTHSNEIFTYQHEN